MNLLPSIKKQALELGFDACGAARYRVMAEEMGNLHKWLDQGLHGGMKYMENHLEMRRDPADLVENVKSVVVCLISYKTDRKFDKGIPQIASYARSVDYHYTVKEKLRQLLEFVKELIPGSGGRAFVDSAPVMEKSWAVEAGLGWIGRNTLLINPELGSFCFIGTLFLTAELDEYDIPYAGNRCGNCTRCIDSCPVGAICEESLINANRCLSCQTIENRGEIAEDIVPLLGDRLYGCDTCQDVCPWNAKPEPKSHPAFDPVEGIYGMTSEMWLNMGNGEFKRRFGHTPMMRTGLKKLKQTLRQKSPNIE